jgi:hypothetical protein
MTATDLGPVEFVYGTDVDDEGTHRVFAFRVTKKTAKRIYYVRYAPWARPGDEKIGYVDRQAIEAAGAEGVWARRTAGWWEPDNQLYLEPPDVPERPDRKAILARLKAEMAAVHPDRGGSHEEFLAAHARYERARTAGR